MSSVGEQFPIEQARVRDLLDVYLSIGASGAFGATIIRQALAKADTAMASGDVIAILRAYEDLRVLK